jgi:hypothetical protein
MTEEIGVKGLALVVCLTALIGAAQAQAVDGGDDGSGAATQSTDGCASPVGYPGDDASSVAIARWMAHGARARGIPGELPVMAALVESGLKNLNSGGADQVGYFGMRVSIWNAGPYAGFPDNPVLQLTWFIDQALQARALRVGAGDAGFGLDPNAWGEWIADVERPAEQFRGRYQPRLTEARELIGPDCFGFPRPRAGDDAYSTRQGTALRVAAPGVLANDWGVGALSAELVSAPAHGTLTMAANGAFDYRGRDGFTGTDSFTYRAGDGGVVSDVATVTLTVVAPPPPPANAFTVGRALRFKNGSTVITVHVPGPGIVSARQAEPSGSRARAATAGRKALVRRATKVAKRAGSVRLAIRPTTSGKRVLRRRSTLTVRVKIVFKPTGGAAGSTFKRVTIKRKRR